MPLNPNGKVDKPALPFPDTVLAQRMAQVSNAQAETRELSATERAIAEVWKQLLPGLADPAPLDESFFDLGGHSILATRLVFQLRHKLGVHVPLGLVFDAPTIAQLAAATEKISSGGTDFLVAAPDAAKENASSGDLDYAKDAQVL